jgi:hypothetical protein
LSSNCNAFKCGTESNGGFQNVAVNNCAIYDTRLAGIALELVDGGVFDRVNVSNITMDNVSGAPIFIRLGNRARPFLSVGPGGSKGNFTPKQGAQSPGMGSMRNIIINNVQATGAGPTGCSITGLPGHPIKNVTLDNIRIEFQGGGKKELIYRDIPENEKNYPEYKMFGTLPAYGFYVRHVQNLRLKHLDLTWEKEDQRPALVCEDVQDLELFDLRAQAGASAPMLVWLKQTQGAFIHACRPQVQTTFVKVDGRDSRSISLMNNDFSGVPRIFEKGRYLGEDALYVDNNRPTKRNIP